jgi:DNA-directed RNA polymerase specialized sigma24 family protein
VPGSADEADAAEAEYRPLLFPIACGMTGSVGDAGDSVQDAFPGLARARGGEHDHRSEGIPDQATRRVILTFARSLAT